jgi:RNA polymerase sigma-B factor
LTQPWTESATARDPRVAKTSTEIRSDVQSPVPESRSPRRRAARRQTDRRRERADFRAYADHRDHEARDRLIRAYLPLADSTARRFDRGGRVPLDDLKQIAALGLLKALQRYDPDHGAAFSSFAVPTIEGEIRRYFRDATWSVRLPRHLQERAVRIEREREQLTSDFGRNPTARELAKRIGCTIEDIIDASEASQARASESFDRTLQAQDGDADTLAERLGYEDRGFAAAEATATLDALLGTRPTRAPAAPPRGSHTSRDRPARRLLTDARLTDPAHRPQAALRQRRTPAAKPAPRRARSTPARLKPGTSIDSPTAAGAEGAVFGQGLVVIG